MPYSVWNTAPTTARLQRMGRYLPGSAAHPAKMLPDIAAHVIRRYTEPGDLVLDPMCGIGTTLVEALYLGRDALGMEYEPRWAAIARANTQHTRRGLAEVVRGDARELADLIDPGYLGQAALVVTSPPYGSSAHGRVRATTETGTPGVSKWDWRYGRDPRNLAYATTDHLLIGLTRILTHTARVLRPGGTAVITARPFRHHGELTDLPTAVLTAGQRAGLTPVERCAALLAGIRDDRLILRPSFFQLKNTRDARHHGLPLHLIAHEDVLIFRKPDTHTPATTCHTRPAAPPPAGPAYAPPPRAWATTQCGRASPVSRPGPPEETRRDRLDDVIKTERPWSLVDRDRPATEGSPRVIVHYVVDGEDGKALGERQAAAIRAVVAWSFAHPTMVGGARQV